MEIISSGQISLIDLNDAWSSDLPPENPSVGNIWMDLSVSPTMIKRWSGNIWVDVGELDPDMSETIEFIESTLGNLANDDLIDFKERQVIKDKITEIIGSVIADSNNSLPTVASLDTLGKGQFWSVRKSAVNAGIPNTDASYLKVATMYNSLKTYLEGLSPIKPWDLRATNKDRVISVVKATFRDRWLQYYIAIDELATATTEKLKKNVDDIEIGGRNLIRNSTFESSEFWGVYNGSTVSGVVDDRFGRVLKITTPDSSYFVQNQMYKYRPEGLKKDEYITISFYVKGSQPSAKLMIRTTGTQNSITDMWSFNITDEWVKHIFVKKILMNTDDLITSNAWGLTFSDGTNGEYFIAELQVERGNKATNWTHAPEDIDNKFDIVEGKVIDVESKVTDSAIINTVRSSTQYRDDLTGKVSTNQVISSINQTAEKVKISAGRIEFEGHVFGEGATFTGRIEAGTFITWDGQTRTYMGKGSIEQANYGNDGSIVTIAKGKIVVGTLVNPGGGVGGGYTAALKIGGGSRANMIETSKVLGIVSTQDNLKYMPLHAEKFVIGDPATLYPTELSSNKLELVEGPLSVLGLEAKSGYAEIMSMGEVHLSSIHGPIRIGDFWVNGQIVPSGADKRIILADSLEVSPTKTNAIKPVEVRAGLRAVNSDITGRNLIADEKVNTNEVNAQYAYITYALEANRLYATGSVTAGNNGVFSSETGYVVLRSQGEGVVYAQGSEFRATEPNRGSTYVAIKGARFLSLDYRTYSATANVYMGTSGEIYRVSSNRDSKTLIEDIKIDPYKILKIKPKDWYDKYNLERYADLKRRELNGDKDVNYEEVEFIRRIAGLIAEEVEEAGLEQFVEYDNDGKIIGVQYDRLWTLLIPIVKELVDKVEFLSERYNIVMEQNQNLILKNSKFELRLNEVEKVLSNIILNKLKDNE